MKSIRWLPSTIMLSMVLGMLGGAGNAWSASPVVVTDIKLVPQGSTTRLVVELNRATTEKVFVLTKPNRVVIDLAATHLSATLPAGQGMVKALRAAPREQGSLRLVLDMTAPPSKVSSNWLTVQGKQGSRLLLDIRSSADAVASAVSNAASEASSAAASSATSSASSASSAASSLAASLVPVKSIEVTNGKARDLVIAIDAGHGGEDPGALGRNGGREKDITLAIARLLKQRIDDEPGMRAVLTRDGDYFVPLRDRINRARQMPADMFISIHADSVRDSSVSGSSVYTLSEKGATNEAARYLADRENAADLIGGVSLENKSNVLASVLLDLTQGASMSASLEAASRVLKQLDRVGDTHHSQVQQAGFVVLKSPDIPSMLVETAFISNPREEARLKDAHHQASIADAILAGVRDYFRDHTPPGTRLAQLRSQRQSAQAQ